MTIPEVEQIFSDIKKEQYYDILKQNDGRNVAVNSFTHNVGSFYEKIRYAVDYKDEHNIARDAVARMLKRILTYHNIEKTGELLITELVSARYLPNDAVGEKNAEIFLTIIKKYFALAKELSMRDDFAIRMASSEIERFLNPRTSENPVANAFYNTVSKKIDKNIGSYTVDFNMCLYIACRKKIFDEDVHGLRYFVLMWKFPKLLEYSENSPLSSSEQEEIKRAVAEIDRIIASPLLNKMISKLRNDGVYFSMIHELVKRYGMGAELYFVNKELLEEKMREVLSEAYKTKEKIVRRSGRQAVMFVLFTKIVIALALEVPFEHFILHHINYMALGTNIIFHPLLLMFMVTSAPKANEKNTEAIVSGVHAILAGEDTKKIYISRKGQGGFISFVYAIFYFVLYIAVLGGIVTVLNKLNFNIASIFLFLLFLALVSYFGIRIRHKARLWIVDYKKRGLISLAFDYATLPVVRMGRWLNEKFSAVNVFVFVLDFVIETPFKILLGTFDNFVSYLNDKKDELV